MQYEIKGGSMPVVVCTLQNGESVKTEKGAMSWMSPNMEMQTNAGDGIRCGDEVVLSKAVWLRAVRRRRLYYAAISWKRYRISGD